MAWSLPAPAAPADEPPAGPGAALADPPAPLAPAAPAPVRRGDAIEAEQLQQAIDASLQDSYPGDGGCFDPPRRFVFRGGRL
eukprot:4830124-Alexandrium_andersonii.AAC.1